MDENEPKRPYVPLHFTQLQFFILSFILLSLKMRETVKKMVEALMISLRREHKKVNGKILFYLIRVPSRHAL